MTDDLQHHSKTIFDSASASTHNRIFSHGIFYIPRILADVVDFRLVDGVLSKEIVVITMNEMKSYSL